jgi:hypothetical protein
MQVMCLRRSKEILSNSLPARTIEIHKVDLGGAREAYDALFQSAAAGFEALLAMGGQLVLQV